MPGWVRTVPPAKKLPCDLITSGGPLPFGAATAGAAKQLNIQANTILVLVFIFSSHLNSVGIILRSAPYRRASYGGSKWDPSERRATLEEQILLVGRTLEN